MPGLIKVGRTVRDTRAWVRELSAATGVPTPFELAFEVFTEDCVATEARIQTALESFRVNSNREFFRYPLKDAIDLFIATQNRVSNTTSEAYVAENIIHSLRDKYPGALRSTTVDIRIVQSENRVWLEITDEEEIADYLKDQVIKRSDVAFVSDDGKIPFFDPADPVSVNAAKFSEEFNDYSIAMTTDVFSSSFAERICAAASATRSERNAGANGV